MDLRPFAAVLAAVLLGRAGAQPLGAPDAAAGGGERAVPELVTFSEHVAPILFRSCLACHRPGESAPFPLLTYADVEKRARQILAVTRDRIMPPWLPAPGHGEFAGNRRLGDDELATIARWVEGGAPEGDPARLPPVPPVTEGWQLGEPDLVLSMPESFLLPAEGRDVFRNFVLPASVARARFVEAVELRPGNKRVVHHAVIRVDRTSSARELDAEDAEPGFPGMDMGLSESPDGHFLGWAPGRVPQRSQEGMGWTLEPGSDLVVQLHMLPAGKPEPIQCSVGFWFTESPPKKRLLVVRLRNDDIDIPAGESEYVLEDSLVLAADVAVTRIAPHAHYLGKRIEAFAELPDGKREELLLIENWDFGWQDEYQYATPVRLPRGTRLAMRYTFDNSDRNPMNPSIPPRRVRGGNSSLDEMATLTFQVLTESAEARKAVVEASYRHRVEKNPGTWAFRLNLGAILAEQRKFAEAATHLRAGLALQPDSVELHTNLGGVLGSLNEPEEARKCFEEALRLSPGNPRVLANLAVLDGMLGRWDRAAEHLRGVLASNPEDARAHRSLGMALLRLDRPTEAAASFERAVALDPRDHESHYQLGRIAFRQGRLEEATNSFLAGLELNPVAEAHADLARVYEARGMRAEAAEQTAAAKRLAAPKTR